MRGRFLHGVELISAGNPTAFRLRRAKSSLLLPAALLFITCLLMVGEFLRGRALVGAVLALVSAWIVAQVLAAAVDRWSFDGVEMVWRTLEARALGFRTLRLAAREVRRVGWVAAGARSRVWLETKAGEDYALAEGTAPEMKRVAEALAHALRLATLSVPPAGVQ